ncbi:methyl-accepting chemotaxis protein [Yersinia mollaretii]|uniref:Methyl-accepting chemotaxis protein n=1 Tax=Yersinia mollaretii TaxID=33060 RepID=A0AA36PPM8_YERMO|nr:methyl-accepting chemotaxis protein [Yersinia mollaretii]MDA5528374.1 methyl-accepting chemotaxis protein [Yersinia mollaretii]MDA5535570.1 methyl-accepting chemotaxis protein [Yersinia mollaretii]MDR7874341.1 methyl-accepting chemotaxis protein [Yersinia mollaretii]NIL03549.1 methyl-accepting chemotaxis protein [Yersinia mollaretii]PHZ32480.1 methyl-accepting chemotaxis protein [Yersinia mollaretii]
MFKKMKISTGLSIVIATFMLFLAVITTFSVLHAISNKENFNRALNEARNTSVMGDAIFNLNSGLAHVNALMLQASLNRPVKPESIDNAKNILAQAKSDMKIFMSTPFNSPKEKQVAVELNTYFERVLSLSLGKVNFIANPASLPDNIDSEMQERAALREQIQNYGQVASELDSGYSQQAEADYQSMITAAIIVVCCSIVMMFFARLWLKRTLVTRMAQTSLSIKKIASGDLSEEIHAGDQNELGLMLIELEKMRLSLTKIISGIRDGVSHIYGNAQEISLGNNDLSARTEEQASALQQTAASMEELKTTVRQNADNAHTARQLAENASLNARSGGDVMTNLEGIMQQITQSSRQIADINGVIDSIANQTNILALNAAVEAARAGEQGRGFAVVAGEVRNLAKRSADAAKEINQLITVCVANMSTGSQQVDVAGTVMKDIVNSVTQVTDIMGEITSASDEQSAGINQIAQAVNEMDQVTQQNAVMVEEAALAASNLETESEALDNIISEFVINKPIEDNGAERKRDKKSARFSSTSVKKEPEIIKNTAEAEWETF